MFAKLGPLEIMAIVAVVGLVFGGKKLPEIGKSFGVAIGNFKKAATGLEDSEAIEE